MPDDHHDPQRLDITSKPAELANALVACEEEIVRLKSALRRLEEHGRHLSAILGQRLQLIFGDSGAPDLDGKKLLRKVEANVKRSVARVLADEKRRGADLEAARNTVTVKARFVAQDAGLNDLTESMKKHIEKKVEKAYGRKPLLHHRQAKHPTKR